MAVLFRDYPGKMLLLLGQEKVKATSNKDITETIQCVQFK